MELLRYRGDITATMDRDRMLGPDTAHRLLTIRSAAYDPTTDTTIVKLRGVLPAELEDRLTPVIEMQRERERIRAVFNG